VAAPLVEPYAGPRCLTGRATAVFFHEVFGHRAEGFRQKDINEGQTFARKVGEQILPNFLSIYDDPTERKLGKNMLLGYYRSTTKAYLRARHSGRSRNLEKF
jgi:TldD protein